MLRLARARGGAKPSSLQCHRSLLRLPVGTCVLLSHRWMAPLVGCSLTCSLRVWGRSQLLVTLQTADPNARVTVNRVPAEHKSTSVILTGDARSLVVVVHSVDTVTTLTYRFHILMAPFRYGVRVSRIDLRVPMSASPLTPSPPLPPYHPAMPLPPGPIIPPLPPWPRPPRPPALRPSPPRPRRTNPPPRSPSLPSKNLIVLPAYSIPPLYPPAPPRVPPPPLLPLPPSPKPSKPSKPPYRPSRRTHPLLLFSLTTYNRI